MNPIKLFKASTFTYTPFGNYIPGDLDFLSKNNIVLVDNVKDADVIISQNYKHLTKYFWRFIQKKKFLVWTNEPRFDTSFKALKKIFFGLIKIHFMNIYTKDVFVSNLSFTAVLINKKLELITKISPEKTKNAVVLMSYYGGLNAPKLIRDGVNIDLITLRAYIATEGYKSSVMDIYGKGWPEGMSKENSRAGEWRTRKQTLLEPYKFNLCFENTIAFNYLTEKIWDSIESYCLPIYYGAGTNVYEIFPENSFIDYSKFNNPKELFDYIEQMPDSEYISRLNKCINVYNAISEKGADLEHSERKMVLEKIVQKLRFIVQRANNK
ncbi:glycosyltransferase family 10 domain-containing protein [Flavobacterium foetidum]|uniref:glycosyltransferase family 10 domain-containing protein n=1 Tax=Flavobacterium foetidum TaxID=2026681 RepID=UPI001074B996|nr:glycosyltransferase family 10 [Flavobacterium foetidum]KAF2513560.1 glycosyl transferase [Flavobacterium foetidum]